MIVDIDQAVPLPLAAGYDICIAGGGVAGIVLAYTLAGRGKRILLLEGGGYEFSENSQSLYSGANIGREYFDLDVTRLRYLGGTSNHWAGVCRPLDVHDFKRRDHIDGSGWPIGITDIQPYLSEAREIMEISDFPAEPALNGSGGRLKEFAFRFSPPVRFGEKYREFLASSDAVDVFLSANLIDIELDPDSGRVSAFAFRGYDEGGPIYKAYADRYVLALGGIENARTLLNANRQVPQGLGNDHDLVGRYFMEHLHHTLGYYVTDSTKTRFGEATRYVSPTVEMMRREHIANAGFRINIIDGRDDGSFAANARQLSRDVLCANEAVKDFVRRTIGPLRCHPDRSGELKVGSEQIPNRNSRIRLSDETDRFGLRRPVLDWQLLPMDKKTIRTGALEIAKYFARNDIGRVKILDWVLDENDPLLPGLDKGEEVGGNHHLGTTRMGASKQDGVVDRDCRMFGVENLYVAGSSVFRTAGHAHPTLTIVQLALRLRDHLAPA